MTIGFKFQGQTSENETAHLRWKESYYGEVVTADWGHKLSQGQDEKTCDWRDSEFTDLHIHIHGNIFQITPLSADVLYKIPSCDNWLLLCMLKLCYKPEDKKEKVTIEGI